MLILSSAASAQTLDRQVDSAGARIPGATGTPADIVTVPLGVAGAAAGAAVGAAGTVITAPIEGRSEGPAYINGDYQHRNENSAPAGGVSETGRKSGVAENPRGIGQ